MTRKAMYSALFIVAFLCSSLGSVVYVESAAAGPSVPCDVKWNNNKNQVKDKHRRKYIGCLIAALKVNLTVQSDDLASLISASTMNCITWKDVINGAAFGALHISSYVPDKNRRSVIACLECRLQQIPGAPAPC